MEIISKMKSSSTASSISTFTSLPHLQLIFALIFSLYISNKEKDNMCKSNWKNE